MFILDTDHLSILEQPGGPARQRLNLVARLAKYPPDEVATTVITYEEQTRGWFSYLARARSVAQELAAYDRLLRHLDMFRQVPVLSYDQVAATYPISTRFLDCDAKIGPPRPAS